MGDIVAGPAEGKARSEATPRRGLFLAVLISLVCHVAIVGFLLSPLFGGPLFDKPPGATPILNVDLAAKTGTAAPSADSAPKQETAVQAPTVAEQRDPILPDVPHAGRAEPASAQKERPIAAGEQAAPTTPEHEVRPTPSLQYFGAESLARRPIPLFPVLPEYPSAANGVSGTVRLLLLINTRGGVDGHRVLFSEPRGVFDDASIVAFSRARYAPGRINANPVNSEFVVEIRFEPGATPSIASEK